MEPVKKHDLRKQIKDFEVQIEIEDYIRVMVERFKGYKQVNKRFSDALIKEREGFHAWLMKDRNHKLTVNKTTGPFLRVSVELYVYGEELTWDKILQQLDRCNFRGQLLRTKQKLAALDTDIETMKKILAYIEIEGCDVKNFSLYSLKSDIEHAIKYSGE